MFFSADQHKDMPRQADSTFDKGVHVWGMFVGCVWFVCMLKFVCSNLNFKTVAPVL